MYQHYVFDIDGTLLDSENAALVSLGQVVEELTGRAPSTEELYATFGLSADVTVARLGVADVELGHRIWIERIGKYRHLMKIFDGVTPVLAALKERGASLGLLTSKFCDEYERDFIPMGISHYFDTVITASDSQAHKPDPAPMLAYLEKSGAQAQDVLYIGDTGYDMDCARGAGVAHALALWGRRSDDPSIEASFRLSSPEDILSL